MVIATVAAPMVKLPRARACCSMRVFKPCQIPRSFRRLPTLISTFPTVIAPTGKKSEVHFRFLQTTILMINRPSCYTSSIEQLRCKFPGEPGSHSLPFSFDPFPDSAKQSSLAVFQSILVPQSGWRPLNFSLSNLMIWAHHGSIHSAKIQFQPFGSP